MSTIEESNAGRIRGRMICSATWWRLAPRMRAESSSWESKRLRRRAEQENDEGRIVQREDDGDRNPAIGEPVGRRQPHRFQPSGLPPTVRFLKSVVQASAKVQAASM